MHPVDVKAALESAVLCLDTREQDTPRLRARLKQIGWEVERHKLDFGDYSARCNALSLVDVVSIERKMSIDELCECFTRGRPRFEREFERAKAANATMYLLIEGASWEAIYAGKYRSKMKPEALVASICAFLARYDCQILFCKPETTGALIRDTLYRELKERLAAIPDKEVNNDADV